MFTEGNILYFPTFYFKNGNDAKAKFFIVLKNTADANILATLPTSKNQIPEQLMQKQGCIDVLKGEQHQFNCFLVLPNKVITTCNKSFNLPTYIYGHHIDRYEKKIMNEFYPLEGVDFRIWGKMKNKVFKELIACLKASKSVKVKYIKILNS